MDSTGNGMGSTGNNVLLSLEEVSKHFFTEDLETRALDGIDMTVKAGEFVSIEGPSGCGKSTLLSIIGLLDQPTAGRYLLKGNPVENLTPDPAGADSQPRDRLRFSGIQPDWRPDGLRKCGTAAHLSRHAVQGAG
jgi:ABC-type glutathione transport system ATPase component